jgi:hypothetical protein
MQTDGLVKRQANLTSFKPGENRYTRKADRVAAKVALLRAEYDPGGQGLSPIDENRLCLAAKHLTIAETSDDPTECVRSTRTAEYLLAKLSKPLAAPRLPAADQAALALELLLKRSSDEI